MKARLFLLALALLPKIAAEARAQVARGGRPLAFLPFGPAHPETYDQGYSDGYDWALRGHTAVPDFVGHDGLKHVTYSDGFHDGLRAGSAFAGNGTGGSRIGGVSINGVNVGGYGVGGYGVGGYGVGGYGTMNPVAAAGQYNLNSSMAAVNYQQAYQQSIQNQKSREETYFGQRRMNASYRAEQEMMHPHATSAELAAFSRARVPAPLSTNDFDPARGMIQWPGVLKRPEFAESRTKLAALFSQAAADPHSSGLGTQNYRDLERSIGEMSDQLHSEIATFEPSEYIAASKFLKSLAHHASMPGASMPGAQALAKQ
jgi:hypothetical protein